ncbi:MAG: TlpA disulfide reductase family protein [Arcicella sp.]|nr:TlpA disulfide reductase family protein [Arcicella sp.]
MKKSLILLTLTSTLLFTACSSKKQAESSTVENTNLTATSLYDVDKKVFEFKDITSKHKVTYVDFWASWCGPCRGEMPAAQELREAYKGKDVNFVYISLDEDSDDWMGANTKFALPAGHSFVLPNVSASSIPAQFAVNSIPRYMLIDSLGNVVNDNAPRPSETEAIKASLDGMLK